jgi:hypothetical protein
MVASSSSIPRIGSCGLSTSNSEAPDRAGALISERCPPLRKIDSPASIERQKLILFPPPGRLS